MKTKFPIIGKLRAGSFQPLEMTVNFYRPGRRIPVIRLAAVGAAALLAGACSGPRVGVYDARTAGESFRRESNAVPAGIFVPSQQAASKTYATTNEVAKFSAAADQGYKLGPGDKFSFVVRGRPDISREEIIVSPDGEVALPRVGVINVAGRSLSEVTTQLNQHLRKFYDDPEVTLVMRQYANNKVFVLGRVANPGAVNFQGRGSLLEALALSGGLPTDTAKSFLSRCMIVRGSEMVIWINLRDLLENGNMALNARLQNGDVVFIPQSDDQLAYVMGAVLQPGVLVLRSTMTVLDAVMGRGGPTKDADVSEVYLARQVDGKGVVESIDLNALVTKGDMRKNYVLKEGDIVYVSQRGASKFNYYMTQLFPSMTVVDFALRSSESFGAMAELRNKLWGQQGFVGTGVTTTTSPAPSSGTP